ncbi:unnamed protein product [Calypogeia fissa]
MVPNCRSPTGSHYSNVDYWKTELRPNRNNGAGSGPDLPKTPRPATCPVREPNEMSRQCGHARNCCRTTADIPHGANFPVEDALNSFGERRAGAKPAKHVDYGYEVSWRPSRAVVPVKDIMEPCVVTPAEAQFRPSIKVIDSGTGAWSEKWKASKRHIDPGRSKDFQWRPCVRTSHPHKVGHEEAYRPQVRPDPTNSSLETNQGHFKPIRRHILPYTPLRQPAPYPQKRHIIIPAEWVPPFRIQGEDYNTAPPRRLGKGRVQQYAASHAPLCLAWEAPERPGSVPSPTDRPGLRRNMRRYIPSGHLSHFENKNCCVCKVGVGEIQRRTLRNQTASGPYHETVPDRNPIVGHMPETDVFQHTRVSKGPALYGPAGSINADIIDHKFSELRQVKTPVSEMKDQYRRWENGIQNNS